MTPNPAEPLPGGNRAMVVIGPTASGKSALGVSLAQKLGGEVVCADSAQVYRELPILTDRTTPEKMGGIPHHLTGFLSLGQKFSVARYQEMAYGAIREILGRGRLPVIAGGTFLYVRAVVEAYTFPPQDWSPAVREALELRLRDEGGDALYQELKAKDPAAAKRIHPNNVRRVIRALEVMEATGRTFSSFYGRELSHPLGLEPFFVSIELPRELIYSRIDRRVERMFAEGALEEVRSLEEMGRRAQMLESGILGCREILAVLDGLCTRKEGMELLKRNTRRYAKRQMTWIHSLEPRHGLFKVRPEKEEELEEILKVIKGSFASPDN